MPFISRTNFFLCVAASLAVALSAQEEPKKNLTARQLFYAAVQTPPSASKADTAKPATKPVAARPQKVTPKPVHAAQADGKPPAAPHSEQPSLPDGGQVINASSKAPKTNSADAAGTALGLRYTILKLVGSSTMEVATDSVFRAGDRIQLRVEANNAGYLYIINQGSSGTWKPIFPSAEIDNGNNRVESLHAYTLPSEEHRMVFDETAGAEKLFIILSREPEPDLEKMIYSLRSRPAGEKSDEPAQTSKELIMAANLNIDNDTVGRMRSTYARDLIIEKVTPASSGEKKETAVYVVNPTGSSSSRVVADLSLVHQ